MARKILIIDDAIELLKMLKKYFILNATDPYEIITAQNGMEGLDKINAQPDLILLDINMPTIDGIEVCQKIREQVNCPIIFLTARVEEQDIVTGLSVGGDDYILKPFRLKELEARIASHLKREARHSHKTSCRFQGELSIDYTAKTVQIRENTLELTKVEYEILAFLSMHPGMVFDR